MYQMHQKYQMQQWRTRVRFQVALITAALIVFSTNTRLAQKRLQSLELWPPLTRLMNKFGVDKVWNCGIVLKEHLQVLISRMENILEL